MVCWSSTALVNILVWGGGMPTMVCRPSWVGSEWFAYRLDHVSSGALVGFRGSLALLSTLAWQGLLVLTLLSSALSLPGNQGLTRSCLLVAPSPWCALCPMSTPRPSAPRRTSCASPLV